MLGKNEFDKKQLVFVFSNDGEKISFKNDNLVVMAKNGEIKFQSTCYRVLALFIVGGISITSGLIERSHKFAFPIFLMKTTLRTYDVIGFSAAGNTQLHRLQYSYEGLGLAKHLVHNKILNQCSLLKKRRYKNDDIKYAISNLSTFAERVHFASNINELMGIEGIASRVYFEQHFDNYAWQGRQPRLKADYLNATMDIGYTLLFNFIEAITRIYGFDPYVGVFHTEFYKRKSLICDLIEPFRPIVDDCLRTAISKQQCKECDFKIVNKVYKLSFDKQKEYTLFLLKPILKHKMQIFEYIQAYYWAFGKSLPAEDFPVFELSNK